MELTEYFIMIFSICNSILLIISLTLLLFNMTPMTLAIKHHAYDIISMLVEHGADKEIEGKSILEIGLEVPKLEIVKACVDKGEYLNKSINVHFLLYEVMLLEKHHFVLHARRDQMILHNIS